MSSGFPTDDCYFYYNSVCSKGYDCPFRHEPAARATETVCYYWKSGGCSRPHCTYRHMEMPVVDQSFATNLEKKIKQCFWDLQPSGCQKFQCPFLHSKKIGVEVGAMTADSGSIIVNKNKLECLKNLLPADTVDLAKDQLPRRMVILPGTGNIARQAVTGGIKNRLGKLGDIKNRLGSRGEDTLTMEDSGDETTGDIMCVEEQKLRESAIKSIDLRNRLHYKDKAVVERLKKVKKVKKENEINGGTIKKKMKEKVKLKEDLKELLSERTRVLSRISKLGKDLPSASDYSDLDTPRGSPDPQLITVMSKTSGMYADINTYSKSAKVRLGRKRKISSDESPRQRSVVDRGNYCRNPSPPEQGELEYSPSPPPTKEYSLSPPPPRRSTRSDSPASPSHRRAPGLGLPPGSSEEDEPIVKRKKKEKTKKNKKAKKGEKSDKKKSKKIAKSSKRKKNDDVQNISSPVPSDQKVVQSKEEKSAFTGQEDDEVLKQVVSKDDLLQQMDDFINN